jgi:uncharacterized protein (DUF1501 family)
MINRRQFLQGCGAAAGISLLPMKGLFMPGAFAANTQHPVLVYLFLRGGMDGLHLMPPASGTERVAYESARSNLAIPTNRLRPIQGISNWAFHPRLGGGRADAIGAPVRGLHRLFEQGRVAVVQGTGMPQVVNRSHFETQAFVDLGTPGDKTTTSGWLTRFAEQATNWPSPLISSQFAFTGAQPLALRGANNALTSANAEDFRLDGFHWSWNNSNSDLAGHTGAHTLASSLWQGEAGELGAAGLRTAEALEYMREIEFRLYNANSSPDGYQPEGGANYPSNDIGTQLRHLAQLIKLDTGMVCASLDYGGWDTHDAQGMPNPGNATHWDYFGERLEPLSMALEAFYQDLAGASQGNLMDCVQVVVLSEFGRRVRSNSSAGTDHGYGNLMMALGAGVNGGLHGSFPGLDDLSLQDGQDLAVSTDYRQVLAEAMVRRVGFDSNRLEAVFPGLGSYQALGIFQNA